MCTPERERRVPDNASSMLNSAASRRIMHSRTGAIDERRSLAALRRHAYSVRIRTHSNAYSVCAVHEQRIRSTLVTLDASTT